MDANHQQFRLVERAGIFAVQLVGALLYVSLSGLCGQALMMLYNYSTSWFLSIVVTIANRGLKMIIWPIIASWVNTVMIGEDLTIAYEEWTTPTFIRYWAMLLMPFVNTESTSTMLPLLITVGVILGIPHVSLYMANNPNQDRANHPIAFKDLCKATLKAIKAVPAKLKSLPMALFTGLQPYFAAICIRALWPVILTTFAIQAASTLLIHGQERSHYLLLCFHISGLSVTFYSQSFYSRDFMAGQGDLRTKLVLLSLPAMAIFGGSLERGGLIEYLTAFLLGIVLQGPYVLAITRLSASHPVVPITVCNSIIDIVASTSSGTISLIATQPWIQHQHWYAACVILAFMQALLVFFFW